jgi:hypothetical protein
MKQRWRSGTRGANALESGRSPKSGPLHRQKVTVPVGGEGGGEPAVPGPVHGQVLDAVPGRVDVRVVVEYRGRTVADVGRRTSRASDLLHRREVLGLTAGRCGRRGRRGDQDQTDDQRRPARPARRARADPAAMARRPRRRGCFMTFVLLSSAPANLNGWNAASRGRPVNPTFRRLRLPPAPVSGSRNFEGKACLLRSPPAPKAGTMGHT